MTASGKLGISYRMSQQVTEWLAGWEIVRTTWIDLVNPCLIEFVLDWIGWVDDEQVNGDWLIDGLC